jgi:hypothetical protein
MSASARLSPRLATPLPRALAPTLTVLGSGRAVRAMLTVAALSGHPARLRIWCRHQARAELLRVHLADLPPLDAEIVVADSAPLDEAGPVVLAIGARTSRKSRQKSKDALFAANMEAIAPLIPRLKGRSVIVVTNPSTLVTARLAEAGVHALGVGVMNDQLRFERDGPGHVRLVGAHNPFELGFGLLAGGEAGPALSFSRQAYRDLANRQDRQRPLLDPDGWLARRVPAWHEAAWRDLGAVHDGLDAAKRWYARQRLASRYLENGIACGRAILALADLLTGRPSARADVTAEAPLLLEDGRLFVAGWPLESVTGEPRALAFDAVSSEVIAGLSARYRVSIPSTPRESVLVRGPGGPWVRCLGSGLGALLPDAVPLAAPLAAQDASRPADIQISLIEDGAALRRLVTPGDDAPVSIAQHRGKNPFEHRDLVMHRLAGERRLVTFAASGGVALVDDGARQITLAVPEGQGRRDEFRKLLRDQILTPAYAASGAWVLHAGLVRWQGRALLLLGDSGAGKTTGALHLLSSGPGGYGASERVLVFMRNGALQALGVPESLTIFRGSLRGLPGFVDLVRGQDAAGDWSRDRKIRLSRDEVVSRLGTVQMPEPAPVDRIAFLRYDPSVGADAVTTPVTAVEARAAALEVTDLTTTDDVRAAWLDWFQPRRDPAVAAAITGTGLPFVDIAWRDASALARELARP